MGLNKKYLTAGRGPESDECLTPRYAVAPILNHAENLNCGRIVWCPFDDENSWYVKLFTRSGWRVEYGHIANGEDFFNYEPDEYDIIVSNGPFSRKDEVLVRLYELNKPFALLLPQNALQSINRVDMYMKYGLQYLGFDKRVCYYTRGELDAWKPNNHFASGYFCRDVLPESLMFEKLEPIQEPHYEINLGDLL